MRHKGEVERERVIKRGNDHKGSWELVCTAGDKPQLRGVGFSTVGKRQGGRCGAGEKGEQLLHKYVHALSLCAVCLLLGSFCF